MMMMMMMMMMINLKSLIKFLTNNKLHYPSTPAQIAIFVCIKDNIATEIFHVRKF